MFGYNEYVQHEHRKDLLRSAAQARLVKQAASGRPAVERLGWLLLNWGAQLAPAKSSECYSVESAGQVVTVCPT